jgi:hypothetical protein
MAIPKQFANKVLSNLDNAAARIESLAKSGQMDPRVASALVRDVDAFADRFEEAAFGKESLMRRQAKLIQGDADEKTAYMNTFANPNKVIEDGTGHNYLAQSEKGERWNYMPANFAQDRTTTVSERAEFSPEHLSDYGTATKQPSMTGSMKQHKASSKTWAD